MGRPSYDEETLAAYFYPPQAAIFDDPVAGPALRRLAAEDPDILAAVADVDRSQIRDCMKGEAGMSRALIGRERTAARNAVAALAGSDPGEVAHRLGMRRHTIVAILSRRMLPRAYVRNASGTHRPIAPRAPASYRCGSQH